MFSRSSSSTPPPSLSLTPHSTSPLRKILLTKQPPQPQHVIIPQKSAAAGFSRNATIHIDGPSHGKQVTQDTQVMEVTQGTKVKQVTVGTQVKQVTQVARLQESGVSPAM